jgi:hypothetical protein
MTSDVRIDREGAWHYRGVEMTRRDIVRLFYRNLRQDASGRYFIKIGNQSYPVEADDTAYVIWALEWSQSGDGVEECVRLLLSDDTSEDLDPGTLQIRKDNILYCRVKDGHFDARFSSSSYYELAEHVQYNSITDSCFILLGGKPYFIEEIKSPQE